MTTRSKKALNIELDCSNIQGRIESMGGTLSCENQPGEGTHFTARVPQDATFVPMASVA